jgi:NitT/TauT family transport system substrate-binding protein
VRANGLGGVEASRLDESIDQIGLVYSFKTKPKADDIFDASFLPPADKRKMN